MNTISSILLILSLKVCQLQSQFNSTVSIDTFQTTYFETDNFDGSWTPLGIILLCVVPTLVAYCVIGCCLIPYCFIPCWVRKKIENHKTKRGIPLIINEEMNDLIAFDETLNEEYTTVTKINFDHETDLKIQRVWNVYRCCVRCDWWRFKKTHRNEQTIALQSRKAMFTETHFYYSQIRGEYPEVNQCCCCADYEQKETHSKIAFDDIGSVELKMNRDYPIPRRQLLIKGKDRIANATYEYNAGTLDIIDGPLSNASEIKNILLSKANIISQMQNANSQNICCTIQKNPFSIVLWFIFIFVWCIYGVVSPFTTFEYNTYLIMMDKVLSIIAFLNSLILLMLCACHIHTKTETTLSRISVTYPLFMESLRGRIILIIIFLMITIITLLKCTFMVWGLHCKIMSLFQWIFVCAMFGLILSLFTDNKYGFGTILCIVFALIITGGYVIREYSNDVGQIFVGYFLTYYRVNTDNYCEKSVGISMFGCFSMLLFVSFRVINANSESYAVDITETKNSLFNHHLYKISYNIEEFTFHIFIVWCSFAILMSTSVPLMESIAYVLMSWSLYLMIPSNKWLHKIICNCGNKCLCMRRKYLQKSNWGSLFLDKNNDYACTQNQTIAMRPCDAMDCSHIQTIIQTIIKTMTDYEISQYLNENNIDKKELLNAYIHLMSNHYNDSDLLAIKTQMSIKCWLDTNCIQFHRRKNDNNRKNIGRNTEENEDERFCIGLLDTLHCVLYHSNVLMRLQSPLLNTEEEQKYESENVTINKFNLSSIDT